jgi:predicted transcriptional regulator
MVRQRQLSPLQLAVLRVLWEQKEASVAEVHARLQTERSLALNTVATVLSRLERDGVVAHRTQGRTYLYRALVSDADTRQSMLRQLLDGLFGGSSSALLSQLLDENVDPEELARLRALIDARSREMGAGDG